MNGDEDIPDIHWVVAGRSGMELHGFCPEDTDNPSLKVKTDGTGTWTFTYRDFSGEGKIQVTKGCDYNPLDLIEALFRHMNSMEVNMKTNDNSTAISPTIDFGVAEDVGFEWEDGFRSAWE